MSTEPVTFSTDHSATRQCPFCAETIQAGAIKCRFCSEFLNTNKAKAIENPQPDEEKDILFQGRPSLWGLTGTVIKALLFLALAVFLMRYPLENLLLRSDETSHTATYTDSFDEFETELSESPPPSSPKPNFGLTEQNALVFARYRVIIGLGIAIVVLLIVLLKTVKLKMIRYEVTAERIEWSRGILDRRVDNLDMFRIIDLKMRRSLLDCVLGIGTVSLITTDKTDPEFAFEKMYDCRRLYDIIKKASLEADQRSGVIHLE